MIKVECTNEKYTGDGEFEKCGYILIKPRWEHLIYTIRKLGGHAGKNKCPGCNNRSLQFDFAMDKEG